MAIVIDASAVVHDLLEREEPLLAALEDVVAPHLIDLEFLNAIRRAWAQRRISAERAEAAIADFRALHIERYPHAIFLDRVWELRENVTAYDAAYVALAELLDAPLLTRDKRLAHSSGHHARIEYID